MHKPLIFLATLMILLSCSNNVSNKQSELVDLDSLSGIDWYKEVLETEDLIEINIKDSIPENFTQYLKSINSNFRMASEGELWRSGCSQPMEFDSANIVTWRDEKTGEHQ